MPIYEYKCIECGQEFEVFQRITEEPLQKCNHCAGTLHRLISITSFQLKGTGWYATDYKNTKGKGKELAAESKVDATPEKKTQTQESC